MVQAYNYLSFSSYMTCLPLSQSQVFLFFYPDLLPGAPFPPAQIGTAALLRWLNNHVWRFPLHRSPVLLGSTVCPESLSLLPQFCQSISFSNAQRKTFRVLEVSKCLYFFLLHLTGFDWVQIIGLTSSFVQNFKGPVQLPFTIQTAAKLDTLRFLFPGRKSPLFLLSLLFNFIMTG